MKFRMTLFLAFGILTMGAFGQCTNCNSLDEALKKPKKVKRLIINRAMHKISIDTIPASIAYLVNIEVLYLTDHSLSSVPKEIGNLKKLKSLSFSGCKLTSIPDEIFQLKNLEEIILFNNEFTEEYKEKLKTKFKKQLPRTKLLLDF